MSKYGLPLILMKIIFLLTLLWTIIRKRVAVANCCVANASLRDVKYN